MTAAFTGDDLEAVQGHVKHARKIAAKHNRNGPGCAPPAPEAGDVAELGTLLTVGGSCGGGATLSPEQCRRTATLLQQLSAPAPAVVPVAMEALARLYWWGGGAWSYGYSADVVLGVRDWINGGMAGDLPPLPARVADRCPPLPQAGEGEA